jgi:hypothetical protein
MTSTHVDDNDVSATVTVSRRRSFALSLSVNCFVTDGSLPRQIDKDLCKSELKSKIGGNQLQMRLPISNFGRNRTIRPPKTPCSKSVSLFLPLQVPEFLRLRFSQIANQQTKSVISPYRRTLAPEFRTRKFAMNLRPQILSSQCPRQSKYSPQILLCLSTSAAVSK